MYFLTKIGIVKFAYFYIYNLCLNVERVFQKRSVLNILPKQTWLKEFHDVSWKNLLRNLKYLLEFMGASPANNDYNNMHSVLIAGMGWVIYFI